MLCALVDVEVAGVDAGVNQLRGAHKWEGVALLHCRVAKARLLDSYAVIGEARMGESCELVRRKR